MPGPALSIPPGNYTADEARVYVEYTFIGNYIQFATACLLLYELLTSLDDEVARVWALPWRLPKILFMLNRYVIRAMLVALWILADYPGTSAEFCRVYGYWQMIPLRLAILAAQALVVIRVWAIYDNSRRMFWILTTLYTRASPSLLSCTALADAAPPVELVTLAACVLVATADTQGVAQPAPLSCGLDSRSGFLLRRFASGTWIAPVCFEFTLADARNAVIMVLITLAKLVPRWSWRARGPWDDGDGSSGKGKGPLRMWGSGGNATLDVLARDSLVYFLFIFTFTLANTIIYERDFSAHYHALLLGPTSAISCIAVSRMMINIRAPAAGLGTRGDETGAGAGATEWAFADLSFAESYGGGRGLGVGEEERAGPHVGRPSLTKLPKPPKNSAYVTLPHTPTNTPAPTPTPMLGTRGADAGVDADDVTPLSFRAGRRPTASGSAPTSAGVGKSEEDIELGALR
ncbi:hypothetical protein GGX14DRAFT_542550 [Mycena pura]|uniref:DUF6533 domain-containing protein n=1 Tax=Mycena pura TaxID=153505 RepID=A0AAD6VKU5_9AGAR|nr:hypothetical protein GGX14DRAFT_542550 [Mycena pura]